MEKLLPKIQNLRTESQIRTRSGRWGRETAYLHRARISEGVLAIEVDANSLAEALDVDPNNTNTRLLRFEVSFTLRRRGVETRFIMSGPSMKTDQVLIANIARAHAWLDRIKKGETFDEIAASENTTRKRVQQTLEFAFLAPDIVRDVIVAKQPMGLTST